MARIIKFTAVWTAETDRKNLNRPLEFLYFICNPTNEK